MPPRARKAAATNQVDETVVNQENPGTSEEQRKSTDKAATQSEVAKNVPANEVDVTVINQESLGAGEVKDRNPDPQIVEDSNGIQYDVSKSSPELIDPASDETEQRRARLRQTDAVLNAKDVVDPDDVEEHDHIEVEFLESGLSVQGTVWRKGQILRMEDNETNRRTNADTNDDVWYELSSSEQKERYGKVFFEKR
jgi:hypothetical protein